MEESTLTKRLRSYDIEIEIEIEIEDIAITETGQETSTEMTTVTEIRIHMLHSEGIDREIEGVLEIQTP